MSRSALIVAGCSLKILRWHQHSEEVLFRASCFVAFASEIVNRAALYRILTSVLAFLIIMLAFSASHLK